MTSPPVTSPPVTSPPVTSPPVTTRPVTPSASPASGGYREVARDGGLFAFGAPFDGSEGGARLDAPVVGMALDPWTGATGRWPPTAGCSPSTPRSTAPRAANISTRLRVVGIAADPATGGYWEVAADGGSSPSTRRSSAPKEGRGSTLRWWGWRSTRGRGATGRWAPTAGSSPSTCPISAPRAGNPCRPPSWASSPIPPPPATGRSPPTAGSSPSTRRYLGSEGGQRLSAPVVGMTRDPYTGGYWEVGADGGVFAFDAPYSAPRAECSWRHRWVGIACPRRWRPRCTCGRAWEGGGTGPPGTAQNRDGPVPRIPISPTVDKPLTTV